MTKEQNSNLVSPVVLVVDDDPDLCWALEHVLRELRVRCIRALDGRTALQAARHSRPTMALLDAKLPDIDGLELARNLRMADPGILVLVSTNATRQLKQPKSWGPAARFSTSTLGVDRPTPRWRASDRRNPEQLDSQRHWLPTKPGIKRPLLDASY